MNYLLCPTIANIINPRITIPIPISVIKNANSYKKFGLRMLNPYSEKDTPVNINENTVIKSKILLSRTTIIIQSLFSLKSFVFGGVCQ